ncbi:SWI/SNF-related matrix-associated actin-dependent regulator of chromatin subfamily A containing DEAD/H box 1-like [Rhynochetos jubatus]
MSLYDLDRFRFERRTNKLGQETVSPSAALEQADDSAAAGTAEGDEDEDETTDDSSRPDTPDSDTSVTSEYCPYPKRKMTRKRPYFRNRRGVQFPAVSSDSEDDELRNLSAARQKKIPRRDVIVISEQSDDDDEQPEIELPRLVYVSGVGTYVGTMKLPTVEDIFPDKSARDLLKEDRRVLGKSIVQS